MLARVTWMMAGPGILLMLGFSNATTADGWLGKTDIVFLGVLAATIFARWFEYYKGIYETATGAPATLKNFYKYALIAVIIGGVFWKVTNFIGNWG
jgi:hypothetical protein